MALYQVAHDQHYVRPQMVQDQIIQISSGRHPLTEHTTTFVPNNVYSGKQKDLVTIITGPNNCGKSTYIKQTALIIFLAHIGSYVPASEAVIGVVSQIYTKIMACDSLSLESSSFLQDVRQVYILSYGYIKRQFLCL